MLVRARRDALDRMDVAHPGEVASSNAYVLAIHRPLEHHPDLHLAHGLREHLDVRGRSPWNDLPAPAAEPNSILRSFHALHAQYRARRDRTRGFGEANEISGSIEPRLGPPVGLFIQRCV